MFKSVPEAKPMEPMEPIEIKSMEPMEAKFTAVKSEAAMAKFTACHPWMFTQSAENSGLSLDNP